MLLPDEESVNIIDGNEEKVRGAQNQNFLSLVKFQNEKKKNVLVI